MFVYSDSIMLNIKTYRLKSTMMLHTWHGFSKEQICNRATMFHNLKPSQYITFRINKSFSLFHSDQSCNIFHMFFNQILILKHYSLSLQWCGLAPTFKGRFSCTHSSIHFIQSTAWNLSNNFISGWVMDIYPFSSRWVYKVAINDILSFSRNFIASKT